MKKTMKKWFSLLLALTLVLVNAPVAFAQGITFADLSAKTQEALSTFTTVAFKGNASVAMEQSGQSLDLGEMKVDGSVDIVNLEGQVNANITSAFVAQAPAIKVLVKGNSLFTALPDGTWTEKDASKEKAEFKQQLDQIAAQVAKTGAVSATPEQVAATEKYFDLAETDSEYVLSLKQDIDGKKLYEENKEVIEQAKAQAFAQAEKQGKPMTDEQKAVFEKVYSADTFAKFFASKPKYEIHYYKDSNLPSKVVFELTVKPADFVPNAEEAQNLPSSVTVKGDFSFEKYGEALDLKAPEATEASTTPTGPVTPSIPVVPAPGDESSSSN